MTVSRTLGFQIIAAPATPSEARKPGLLRRLFDALLEARESRAQRTVDEYVARNGGRLTDSVEREIGERMLGSGGMFGR